MAGLDRGKQRLFLFLATISVAVFIINLILIFEIDVRSKIQKISIHIPLAGAGDGQNTPPDPNLPKLPSWHQDNGNFEDHAFVDDQHPIAGLMKVANEAFNSYEDDRSMTFKETVTKYRRAYGRHPPPGFRDWYKFSRDRIVHNVDDFDQIMDDLRPFWGLDPAEIRSLATRMSGDEKNATSGLHIRNKKVWKMTNPSERVEKLAQMIEKFVKYLPDMDIIINRLDQPRVIVPWEDIQKLLVKEEAGRHIPPEAIAEWTNDMTGFYGDDTPPSITDPQWFSKSGEQYMLLAKDACPPESQARNGTSRVDSAESLYKDLNGGFITNFNRSSDLCTIGPDVEERHGFLFAPSTIIASRRLLPVFGQSKVNVNNDILFPASTYYASDDVYTYDAKYDYDWDDKDNKMFWRGTTSGGTNTADNWEDMHRQRLVLFTNSTVMGGKEARIMTIDPNKQGDYTNLNHFPPSKFAASHTDVGFTRAVDCSPDCSFYDGIWAYKATATLNKQFKSKFLVDVDGNSFSETWRAFLQSKSLGIKSTIFREWHDSRLFAWRHFVPLDNRYDELYSILTYFIGLGRPAEKDTAYVPRHDFEARKLGQQGREWAGKVLRREDMEIYMFRLLIEYARVIDDNRDRIGYSGDGSELDKYDTKHPINPASSTPQ